MSKSSKSKPKRTQMHPKRAPESFQDQRCDQREPEKVSRRGPKAPGAAQRSTKAEKYEKHIVKSMFSKKTSNSFSKTKVLLIKALPGDPPREGRKFAPAFWKNNSVEDEPHFWPKGGQKTKRRKEAKNVKSIFEKVRLTTVSHFRPPQSHLLEKKVPGTM